ncbi:MAG TPA: MmgE/PrpD family protein [Candidatus Saccharimonadales bacterium]|nr:MmgE/PrpD family protein [Candidatus Saccharimonadales bacterium]
MGQTETAMAKFVLDFPTEDVPADVMHLAKRCLMNYSGVALLANLDPAIDILLDVLRAEGCAPAATVIGKGFKTSVQNAALANGFLGHFEDYDDTHTTVIHPSAPILPGALALSEQRTVTGKDFLAAFAVGVEVACRIGLVLVQHFREGAAHWHITNTCGVLGAAAAAGRLLKLNQQQMVYGFAIAGTQASGLREVFGSMCKPFHAGKAAQNGTMAALLAQRGFTGTDGIFEGARGLVGVMASGHDIGEATKDLGKRWELPQNGLKPFACGQANHGFIDAALALRKQPGVTPQTIKHIQGSVEQFAPALVRRRHPRSGLESKFCYYHSVAAALIDGQALPAQFTDERAADPAVESLRNRIDFDEDSSLPRRAVRVTLELTDGRTYTERVDHPTGTPGNPMSDTMVREKFHGLASAVLGVEKADKAQSALWGVDAMPDVSQLIPLLLK